MSLFSHDPTIYCKKFHIKKIASSLAAAILSTVLNTQGSDEQTHKIFSRQFIILKNKISN